VEVRLGSNIWPGLDIISEEGSGFHCSSLDSIVVELGVAI
jgi:hypothetical protein